jgi:hypothetical protein
MKLGHRLPLTLFDVIYGFFDYVQPLIPFLLAYGLARAGLIPVFWYFHLPFLNISHNI